jgi:hypothetical protein
VGSRRVYGQDYIEEIAHAPTAMADWSGEVSAPYPDQYGADEAFPEEDWHDLEYAPRARPRRAQPRAESRRAQPREPSHRAQRYVETPLSVAVPVPPAPSSLTPYMLDELQPDATGESPASQVRMPWEVTSFMVRAQQRARLMTLASVAGAAIVIAAAVAIMFTAGVARERERANAALPTMTLPQTMVLAPPSAEPFASAGVVSPPASAVTQPGSVLAPPAGVVAPPPAVTAPPSAAVAPRSFAPAPAAAPRVHKEPRAPRASVPPPAPPSRPAQQKAAPSSSGADESTKKVLDEARHVTDDAL